MIKLAALGAFFRKPTSPPLNLKRSSKTHQSSLTLKFFLKSTRPSFFDKAGCTRQFESELSLRSFAQLFPIKEGSTAFPKPLFLMEKVGCTRQYESELSLRSFAQPFPSGDKGCTNRPFNSLYDPFGSPYRGQKRCSNRYAIRLADHQRSTPAAELRFFVRDEPHGHTIQDVCCLLDACCLLELLFEGTADKMDGALRNLLILSSYSP